METNRRNWLRQTSILLASVGLAPFDVFSSPINKLQAFLPVDSTTTVRLSSNENPYGPSPLARTAMAESIEISNRYQWKQIQELISIIAAHNSVAYHNVLLGAGSTQIIDAVIQFAALQRGNYIVADQTFDRWTNAAEQSGLHKIQVPLTSDKQHDLPAMLHAITAQTRVVYLCNPNNPTGTICSYDALSSFISEATKKTLVLLDEAYIDYSNETSLSGLVAKNENLVVVKTFSKIYGLAGARIGYALAHNNTIEKIARLQSGSHMGISTVSMAAAIASLKDTAFLKKSFQQNEKARSYTIEQLERLNIPCIRSNANFVYFSLANFKGDFFAKLTSNNIEGTRIFEEKGKWSRITIGRLEDMKKFIEAIEH